MHAVHFATVESDKLKYNYTCKYMSTYILQMYGIHLLNIGLVPPREACVVPMPPWCTQTAICGNSHSWGAACMFCISELIQVVTVSSQSTCKDAVQPLQGFNMHPTITS